MPDITVDVSYTIIDPQLELIPWTLCVIARPDKAAGDSVSPSNPEECIGAGICSEKDNSGRHTVVVDGVEYKFTPKGIPANNNAMGWKCYLAQSQKTATGIGNIVGNTRSNTIVRKDDGSIEKWTDDNDISISIDSLNARDQYALQVLRGILEHIPNPAALSANEISYYCDKAYEWASYLMTTAAASRATARRETPINPQEVALEPEDLASNTEILLNNLIMELAKSDYTEGEGDSAITSKRVTVPQVGQLKAVIESQNDILKQIKNSMDNITVKVTYTE